MITVPQQTANRSNTTKMPHQLRILTGNYRLNKNYNLEPKKKLKKTNYPIETILYQNELPNLPSTVENNQTLPHLGKPLLNSLKLPIWTLKKKRYNHITSEEK